MTHIFDARIARERGLRSIVTRTEIEIIKEFLTTLLVVAILQVDQQTLIYTQVSQTR